MRFILAGLKYIGVFLVVTFICGWAVAGLNQSLEHSALNNHVKKMPPHSAEVIRDDYGVPHIYGNRDADVAYGLAWAHSEDDFETLQETIAVGRGRLARYRGISAAPIDYMVSLLGIWESVEANRGKNTPKTLALAEGYAAGMNAYAQKHKSKVWPGLFPVTADDIIAGFAFRTPFFYGLDGELLPLFTGEAPMEVSLAPTDKTHAFSMTEPSMAERGSNAFAVAPHRSGDRHTRLFINSHQPFKGPVAWYEAHLNSKEGLEIYGGVFPGSPLILHGFNPHLGWANTVSKPDLSDVYLLDVADDRKSYQLDGTMKAFEVSYARLQLKLFGPFYITVKRKVLRSAHGPVIEGRVIDGKSATYAIRYAGMGETRQLDQYYALNLARDLDMFEGAMALNHLPSINYIYADKVGNIGFMHNGQYPARPNSGHDWRKVLPGDRSDLIWQGYNYDLVPMLFNPASGFLFNANNDPTFATDGPDNLRHEDFPANQGLQRDMTNRAFRSLELARSARIIDREALIEMKFDTAYSDKSLAAGVVAEVLAADFSGEPALAQAQAHLAEWNLRTDYTNRHAALGVLTTIAKTTEALTGIPAPEPAEAFKEAVRILDANYGRLDVEWQQVNRHIHGDFNMGIDGAPDVLRAIYPAEIREDGQLHAVAGDTWIALVEWAPDGAQRAEVIHQFGSATLDASSPHYADQAEMFVRHEFREALLTREAVEAVATRQYKVGED